LSRLKTNYTILIFIIFTLIIISQGCLKTDQHGSLEYSVSVETDREIILYVPLTQDKQNQPVLDIINHIKVGNGNDNSNISYEVVDTKYGKALRIKTMGNTTLQSSWPYRKYLQNNPQILIDPDNMHFDMSMKKNSTFYEDRGTESYHWIFFETKNNNTTQYVKVKLDQKITTSGGVEYWTTYENDKLNYGYSTLKPGWQLIRIESGVAVY